MSTSISVIALLVGLLGLIQVVSTVHFIMQTLHF
jgi:hypothetical protein